MAALFNERGCVTFEGMKLVLVSQLLCFRKGEAGVWNLKNFCCSAPHRSGGACYGFRALMSAASPYLSYPVLSTEKMKCTYVKARPPDKHTTYFQALFQKGGYFASLIIFVTAVHVAPYKGFLVSIFPNQKDTV